MALEQNNAWKAVRRFFFILTLFGLILLFVLLVGILVGNFMVKTEAIGLFVIGGTAGLVSGSIIYMTMIAPFEFIQNENFGLIVC